MDPKLQQEIQFAAMLVQFGVSTVEQVMAVFKANGNDDDTLAAIQAGVESRLARHNP